jgi:hypothetical protein
MDPNTPYEQPEPNEEPTPDEEQPAPPEHPKRRRIHQPVFSTSRERAYRPASLAMTGLVLCLAMNLHAQTPTPPSTNPTGQQTTTPQAVTPQQGWVMFDDNVGRQLQMPPEQLQQLRAVDERFLNDYRALGNEPIRSPKYQDLTERRNAEIRKLMDPTVYDTWITQYQPVPNTVQEQRTGGISTPPPPTP